MDGALLMPGLDFVPGGWIAGDTKPTLFVRCNTVYWIVLNTIFSLVVAGESEFRVCICLSSLVFHLSECA